MKKKIIKWGNAHVFKCDCCYDMEQRGYEDESVYWDDFFHGELKPIKYKLIKSWGKKKTNE